MQQCERQPVLIYACLCYHRGEEINMQTSLSNVGKSLPSSMMHRRTHHILVLGFVMEKISMAASRCSLGLCTLEKVETGAVKMHCSLLPVIQIALSSQ